jgi:1-aminocyclopropane-1-carboxylate deaminase
MIKSYGHIGEMELESGAVAPVQDIVYTDRQGKEIRISILREDLLDAELGGNKFRKLRYHLLKARQEEQTTLLSFGGPWSNHLYSLAAAGERFGFSTIGVVRGEEPPGSTETIKDLRKKGMQLLFVSRSEFADNATDYYRAWLHDRLGSFYLIPEGGGGTLGVSGTMEICGEHTRKYGRIFCAAGTGTTAAGMLLSLVPGQRLCVVPAMKGGAYLREGITSLLRNYLFDFSEGGMDDFPFDLYDNFHFGGFARVNPELLSFMSDFQGQTGVALDHVYTGKLLFGVCALLSENPSWQQEGILVLHSGGLQGLRGLKEYGG